MMGVLLGIALLACGCFAFRFFSLKRSVSKAERELREISEELKENRVVKLAAPDRSLESLFTAINENLQDIRQERLSYQQKERELKEQVENISHDLRTPLTGLLGYLKLMDREALETEEREFLETAIRKGHTLEKLISRFYELSCVTSGDLHLKLQEMDVGRCLRECCLDHYGLFERAGLTFTADIPEKAVMQRADPEALERIFTNLLQNAARYAKTGLRVSLVQNVMPAQGRTGIQHVFSAQSGTDTQNALPVSGGTGIQNALPASGGTGIQNALPASGGTGIQNALPVQGGAGTQIVFQNDIAPGSEIDDPNRLFERFYVQEESRSQGGTGLGLTISRQLAGHMNARLEASYSREGERSFLNLTLTFL